MAKIVGVYNNKGGVGKTTLTLFLSDFLSSIKINQKKSKVLVIDFDPQASCSSAILGIEEVNRIKNEGLTISRVLSNALSRNGEIEFGRYIHTRKTANRPKTKKTKIGELDVMVSDAENVLDFDEKATLDNSVFFASLMADKLSRQYDLIFVDFPGNLSKLNKFSLIGAFLVNFVLVPIEPNKININAISGTVDMLKNISQWRKKPYKLLGIILNKADRRTSQYKLHSLELQQTANIIGCKIYENILPPTPKLSNASDDSIAFYTLVDKYDTYYNHVRKLVIEIVKDLGFKINKKT